MRARMFIVPLFTVASVLWACNTRPAAAPVAQSAPAPQTDASAPKAASPVAAPTVVSPVAPTDAELAAVERIDVPTLHAAMARGEVVVVDVRGPVAFEEGHIKGSMVMPSGDYDTAVKQLPTGKKIVTYCS